MNKKYATSVRYSRGFTLLEVMLVMMLLAGLATLIISTPPTKDVRWVGEEIALELRTITHRSVLEHRLYAAVVYRDGIQQLLLTRADDRGVQSELWPEYYWHQVRHVRKKFSGRLPTDITLTLNVENSELTLQAMDNSESQQPQLIFQPDGESSDFIITLFHRGKSIGQIIHQRGNTGFFPVVEKGIQP
ncbi:prepilin-type N-terminal cleavage/methylation domain-containing protein [Erwinia psidii]|uniref:Prepilin-type N-terminal cleavage/methylation domain-containing protein n=1 Tax=Erwinia psidii TaxID=69224 RepID=A0A3N6TPA4_9GAMM|nr:prepilin-type N-terminal cleavage/methylation domain-containing protein [Erwinia psidii]MCX8958082.1 prepilin-type N-terminal cleavage/methylation domain-containing protein [Erwinia psidii]MCX8962482.1 prepilin-type N-terminal cleavage/methylation domain-containing protein [Erwinia psidii]MCX8966384.1 prepilin-type N-terminal cleavage/methylation domain-containing protein [Erwinia psidii]RQM37062.1 prepilin-type N-terminal cleavage/methylation domain-containing protein [Erwinia psidii]